jgi:hypothetical protein
MSNLSEHEAVQVNGLRKRGWEVKHGMWMNPKRTYQGLPYMFTFNQVCKLEGVATAEQLLVLDDNVNEQFKQAMVEEAARRG